MKQEQNKENINEFVFFFKKLKKKQKNKIDKPLDRMTRMTKKTLRQNDQDL